MVRVPASGALLALRLWWPIVVVLAVVGAGFGLYSVQGRPYAAVTNLRVDTAGFGEVAQRSIMETARALVDSNPVYTKVVGESPEAVEALRQRSAVTVVSQSSILQITVSAQTPEQAERDADAMANAAIQNFRELADVQFDSSVESGVRGLNTGRLPDPVAEQARRDRVGAAIAEQQDNALRLSGQLSRIGEILPAEPVGVGPNLSILIGLFGGTLAGAVIALLLGVGRRKIRAMRDLRAVAPSLIDCEPLDGSEGAARVAARCSLLDHPLVVVLALPGAADEAELVHDQLRTELHRDGRRLFVVTGEDLQLIAPNNRELVELEVGELLPMPAAVPVVTGGAAAEQDTEDGYRAEAAGPETSTHGNGVRPHPNGYADSASAAFLPALGLPKRAVDLAESDADMLLVLGSADGATIARVAERAELVLLVAAAGRTTVGELSRACGALSEGKRPVVVLVDGA